MSAAPPHKRPRVEAAEFEPEHAAASDVKEGERVAPSLCCEPTATRLAEYSSFAQSLVTAEEGITHAANTCLALLRDEHSIVPDVAVASIQTLALLAKAEAITWRDLPRLRDQPLAAALTGGDGAVTEQLLTVSEVLQFPKRVSLLLEQQLAVFRVRRLAPEVEGGTAALVRAEPALAPVLAQLEALLLAQQFAWRDCGGRSIGNALAFWLGFFGDPEDVESLSSGRRELDHIAYGAGQVLSGRGLLPDLLALPLRTCKREFDVIAMAAGAYGDVAVLSALHHAGRLPSEEYALTDVVSVAVSAGHACVLRLALDLGWRIWAFRCARELGADLSSDTRLQLLALLRECGSDALVAALPALATCGDLPCVRWVLAAAAAGGAIPTYDGAQAVEAAAEAGQVPVLSVLLEAGIPVNQEAFRDSGDVATLRWFAEHGCCVDNEFLDWAAWGGAVFRLEWVADAIDPAMVLTAHVAASAAKCSDSRVLEWLLARGCPWDDRVLQAAVGARSWGNFVLALQRGCPCGGFPGSFDINVVGYMPLDKLKEAVQALHDTGRGELASLPGLFWMAKQTNKADVAEWLVCDLGVDVTAEDCAGWFDKSLGYQAASRGCSRLLQHLCDRGLYEPGPADMRVVVYASELARCCDAVRTLHARGVATHGRARKGEKNFLLTPHHPTVGAPGFLTFLAARRGALELLQVLVDECGAHLAESTCVAAAEEGHLEVLRWAINKGCPCAVDTWRAAVRCAGSWPRDYRPLDLLHREKRPWSEAVWAQAARWREVQAWLHRRDCPGSLVVAASEAADTEDEESDEDSCEEDGEEDDEEAEDGDESGDEEEEEDDGGDEDDSGDEEA